MTGTLWLSVAGVALAAELAVAVAPFEVLGLDGDQSAALREAVGDALGQDRRDLRLVPAAELDRAAAGLALEPAALATCLREPSCAATLARRAGATRLVLGSAAGLGRTFVLRLSLVDAEREVVDREVQSTVVGEPADLLAALAEQVERLLPRPAQPWYSRWWLWTTVAVALAAAATTTALVLLLPPGDPLPVYPLP